MQRVILDSNIVIYSFKPQYAHVLAVVDKFDICVSAISKVEVLSYQNITPVDKAYFERFFGDIDTYKIDESIINQAIQLKQQKKMSLGDSIIASTALMYDLPLMTRNVNDFAWIDGLTIINPFDE